ncbi:maternal protein exuperantia [Anopheles darlingi]|uniref:Maternal protein exuperantia n=2 Tax=Anopheles darlingi TaxID=43151 RepID=W5JWG6_ANODA|nr:maternal protein exuperantia [Anopheles darlingi]ETN67968.1 maternal protein exuperantia [Anopheles darlingi]
MVVGAEESKAQVEEQQLDDSSFDECDTPAGILSSKFDKTDLAINTDPLPYGKYTLIGIDIDTTGRRLIDEIVQISAFTPDHQYAQYIIPLMNLNPAARQRHQVRVITVGFFRMVKSMQNYRVMKTKPEAATLNDFLDWLEARLKEDVGSEGIVLVYNEQRKFVPYMVIEALKKYKLLDRFTESVKSFANGFRLAEERCNKTIKFLSIHQLAKIVLGENDSALEGFEGNAAYRAKMAFEITRRLATNKSKHASSPTEADESCVNSSDDATSSTADEDVSNSETEKVEKSSEKSATEADQNDTEAEPEATQDVAQSVGPKQLSEEERVKMCEVLCELASPISTEISELDEQEKILVRQNSLRPVFLLYFKTTIYHRVKAVTYRRVLAEIGHDYESLRKVWQESKREGMEAIVNKIIELKEEERTELTELLDCHYDPDKQAFKPIVKRNKHNSNRVRPFFSNKNGNIPQNQKVNNNYVTKENRKPSQHYDNHNNFYKNANHGGKQQNQQQFYNNQTSHPGESGMRHGGSPGKRFRSRHMRRRRGGNNQNNGTEQQHMNKNHSNNAQPIVPVQNLEQ